MGIAALKRLIIERTEGNPFFMEEMVQALFEQGVLVRNGAVKLAKPLDQIRVPPTVQAILASRIDRLPQPIRNCSRRSRCWAASFHSAWSSAWRANQMTNWSQSCPRCNWGSLSTSSPRWAMSNTLSSMR